MSSPIFNSPIFQMKEPWNRNSNTIWLASKISLLRNIEKFNFPHTCKTDRKTQIIALVAKELQATKSLHQPQIYKAENLAPLEKDFLLEHSLSLKHLHHAGSGECFIIDDTGKFMLSVNLQNHLDFQMINIEHNLEETWNQLVKIETSLGKKISYAYSSRFGFITSDHSQCGTGLIVNVYLQLPALVHTGLIDEVLENNIENTHIITGIQGDPQEIIGDVLVIQNNYTIGLTEENIISNLETITTKLLVEEKSCRQQLKNQENVDVKDRVSRAYGILVHSYQIEAVEALNAISLIKLGVELGWIEGLEISNLNEVFFGCRRAHLMRYFSEEFNKDDLPHKRAEYIHLTLKDSKLII